MVSAERWRALALALPGAEEHSHFGNPDFRVDGRIFAGLSAEETTGTLKLTPELQSMVRGAHGASFFPASGAWGRKGWTYVTLDEASEGAIEELLLEAWRLTASKPRIDAYDAAQAAAIPKPTPSKKAMTKSAAKAPAPAAKRTKPAVEDASASKATAKKATPPKKAMPAKPAKKPAPPKKATAKKAPAKATPAKKTGAPKKATAKKPAPPKKATAKKRR